MNRTIYATLLLGVIINSQSNAKPSKADQEQRFLTDVRQLTFDGLRSGEGYFSADGSKLIFQSERHQGNPFYQIYLMDFETGDTDLISPGLGRTTCAWIHPKGEKSYLPPHTKTQRQLKSRKKKFDLRETSTDRRYSWNYDESYDIYEKDLTTGKISNITNTKGYDAEGAYSPDGKWIVFASNREAYEGKLSETQQKQFDHSKAYFMELYIMKSDGSDLRRLTNTPATMAVHSLAQTVRKYVGVAFPKITQLQRSTP